MAEEVNEEMSGADIISEETEMTETDVEEDPEIPEAEYSEEPASAAATARTAGLSMSAEAVSRRMKTRDSGLVSAVRFKRGRDGLPAESGRALFFFRHCNIMNPFQKEITYK